MKLFKDKSKIKSRNKHKITSFENLLKDSTKDLRLLQDIIRNGFFKHID